MQRVQLRDVAVETRSSCRAGLYRRQQKGPGQRFFVLFRDDDFLRATARVPVIPPFAFALPRAAATLFRPLPFGLPA
jgi:hypothetical protein